jgi:hypothetical protein
LTRPFSRRSKNFRVQGEQKAPSPRERGGFTSENSPPSGVQKKMKKKFDPPLQLRNLAQNQGISRSGMKDA